MLSVLVVDDERDLLDLVRHFLERTGEMKVDTAQSSPEALERIGKNRYDAIVVDFYMPEITGIQLLKILRSKGDSTPVIIFTGVGRELAAIEALNNGADFFLQKGEDPREQFRELVHMIHQAKERRSAGRSLGTSQRIIADIMGFSKDAMMAVDHQGVVIAWNEAIEELSGIPADIMIGKKDYAYAEPFLGKRKPMPVDLVFAQDPELLDLGYTVINREKGNLTVWTKVSRAGEEDRVFWMRSRPLYDGKGAFIGAVQAIRDITDSIGTVLKEPVQTGSEPTAEHETQKGSGGIFSRVTGKGRSEYRTAVRLYYSEAKYAEALTHFDRAIEVDPARAAVWNDRGLCLKDMGKYEEARKSFERALELEPKDEEFLYDYGEILEMIGILNRNAKTLELAVSTFAKVTEINPNNASAWNHLGICIKEMGHAEESRQAFERARSTIRLKKDQMFRRKRESVL